LEAQPQAREGAGIHLYAHGRLLPASDEHLSDAFDLRNLLREDGDRLIEELGKGKRLARQREDEDGCVRGIYLSIRRAKRKIGGELPARGGDRGLNVTSRGVNVSTRIELQREGGGAQRARRRDLRQTCDATEATFEGSRDRG